MALLLVVALGEAAADTPRRILLVHPFGSNFAPYSDFAALLRTDLALNASDPADVYEVSLATARFVEGEREGPFVEYLNSLFNGRSLDLIITIGAPAADFFHRNRGVLFPRTPVIYSLVEERRMKSLGLTPIDAAIGVRIDVPVLFENILSVLPQTTNIVVATGASPLELFWLAQLRRELEPFNRRVRFTWLNDLPVGEMVRRVARLPPNSAIFLSLLSVDASGVPYQAGSVLEELRAAANAPIFSYVDSYLGRGIVGGPMVPQGQVSKEVAALASRILRGDVSGLGKSSIVPFGAPRFDWRELRRWGIEETALPKGSQVVFREPTVWELYRPYIAAAVGIGLAQVGLIFLLLANRRTLRREESERRRAEEAAHALSGRLINAHEEERSRLARELHDDVTQRLALMAIEAGGEERASARAAHVPLMRSLREGLVRLSEDVHALSYRLHPSIIEDLGLAEAVRSECEGFARLHPVAVDLDVEELPDPLPKDATLCLFRILQESLRNVARHADAAGVRVSLRVAGGGLRLTVRDNGSGFDTSYSRPAMSLGHASMRQRALLLGGSVRIESGLGQGTLVEAWIPLRGDRHEPIPNPAG